LVFAEIVVMKKASSIGLGLLAVAATGLVLYRLRRKRVEHRYRRNISDEGYETAGDILYPERPAKPDEHYGPVLPGSVH